MYNHFIASLIRQSTICRREIFLLLEFCPFGDLKTFLLEKKQAFLGSINNVPGVYLCPRPPLIHPDGCLFLSDTNKKMWRIFSNQTVKPEVIKNKQ